MLDMKYSWQEFHVAALWEVRPELLRQRIGEAETARQQRLAELRRGRSGSVESQPLGDVLRMLRFPASTECKTTRTKVSGQQEAAS